MNDLLFKAVIAILSNRPKPIHHYLKKHFGREPRKNVILQMEFPLYRHGCVSRAMQRCMVADGRRGTVMGVSSTDAYPQLVDLIHPDSFTEQLAGPVLYHDVELSDGNGLSCPQRALYMIKDGGNRVAVYQMRNDAYDPKVVVEVMARDRHIAQAFLHKLRGLVDARSIYKGRVITMRGERHHEPKVSFHNVPNITREQLILPPSVIDEITRHTSGFSKHRDLLLAQGRHLKRGLLLYGAPGTGKSLTIMHLLSEMPERTTVLLTGNSVNLLESACTLARALQPATIVIDDVDLIAQERGSNSTNTILFELLNQMDGIADDADVLFLLTTNRPEILEPALAARPGRIDQAIFVPLPDKLCRARLFDLYGKGLTIAVTDMDVFIKKTEGASAALIRELFRKAALFAAEEGSKEGVCDRHFTSAVDLLLSGSPLTSKFLGYKPEAEATA
jgi:predicted AAA+ superfamily ATPase